METPDRTSSAARDSECRFTPAWQPGADANLQRAGKQPSAASSRTGRHEQRWWRRWFVIFEPRDLWIGVFVSPEKYDDDSGDFVQRTYFALIPTVVLVRQVWRAGV